MKILMHACCGPCSIVPTEEFLNEGETLYALFENPNIHPYTEWEKRRDALAAHMELKGVPLLDDSGYGFTRWMREVSHREVKRCEICYRIRLEHAAKIAKKGKFDAFTTTLLYSKFQKHALIKEAGEDAARAMGVRFIYRDFRDGWKRGVDTSRELGMYRQQYCGCILSEEERFKPAKTADKP